MRTIVAFENSPKSKKWKKFHKCSRVGWKNREIRGSIKKANMLSSLVIISREFQGGSPCSSKNKIPHLLWIEKSNASRRKSKKPGRNSNGNSPGMSWNRSQPAPATNSVSAYGIFCLGQNVSVTRVLEKRLATFLRFQHATFALHAQVVFDTAQHRNQLSHPKLDRTN